jgi:enoyl-CoA hydratase/carnithine racemase
MTEHITTTQAEGVLTLRMNRPDKRNALTLAMYTALADALTAAQTNDEVRAVLITGAGGTFTAGNDLADFMQNPPTGTDSPVFAFLQAISTAAKPLVAAVEGHAVGVGTTMLLHCDLVYATPGARFKLPFVDLGLVPEAASTLLLPELMGHQAAARLLLLGETLNAPTAALYGLVSEVLEGDIKAAALEKAQALAAKPPHVLRLTKRLMKQHQAEAVQAAMLTEGQHFIELLRSPETMQAIQAFFNQR